MRTKPGTPESKIYMQKEKAKAQSEKVDKTISKFQIGVLI